MLLLVSAVSEKLGRTNALFQDYPDLKTRTDCRIDSLYSTLNMATKGLSREKTAAILEGHWLRLPNEKVRYIHNTSNIYDQMHTYSPRSQKSLQAAHRKLLKGISDDPGSFRNEHTCAEYRQSSIQLAPPPEKVPEYSKALFEFLKLSDDPPLIKGIIAHFSIQYFQPFTFGSGILARLWQSLLMLKQYGIFEFLPYEKQVLNTRKEYEKAFQRSEHDGHPTAFILYMLQQIDTAISQYLDTCRHRTGPDHRLTYFHNLNLKSFTRRDYLRVFKYISPSTASCDLERGVNAGLFHKVGSKNKTVYSCRLPYGSINTCGQ